jgi:hypothetical protein
VGIYSTTFCFGPAQGYISATYPSLIGEFEPGGVWKQNRGTIPICNLQRAELGDKN